MFIHQQSSKNIWYNPSKSSTTPDNGSTECSRYFFLCQCGDLEYIIAKVLTDFKLNFMYLCCKVHYSQRSGRF